MGGTRVQVEDSFSLLYQITFIILHRVLPNSKLADYSTDKLVFSATVTYP